MTQINKPNFETPEQRRARIRQNFRLDGLSAILASMDYSDSDGAEEQLQQDFFAVWLPLQDDHHVYAARYRTPEERKLAVEQQRASFIRDVKKGRKEPVRHPKFYTVPAGLQGIPSSIRDLSYGQVSIIRWGDPVAVKTGNAGDDRDVNILYDPNCVLIALKAFEEGESERYMPKIYRISE